MSEDGGWRTFDCAWCFLLLSATRLARKSEISVCLWILPLKMRKFKSILGPFSCRRKKISSSTWEWSRNLWKPRSALFFCTFWRSFCEKEECYLWESQVQFTEAGIWRVCWRFHYCFYALAEYWEHGTLCDEMICDRLPIVVGLSALWETLSDSWLDAGQGIGHIRSGSQKLDPHRVHVWTVSRPQLSTIPCSWCRVS